MALARCQATHTTSIILTAMPLHKNALTNREWIERTARIMGTPSPAAAPFIGQKIGNSNRRVDQFANNICSAIMPGGGHARLHDHILHTIQDEAHRAGFNIELEPNSIFPL